MHRLSDKVTSEYSEFKFIVYDTIYNYCIHLRNTIYLIIGEFVGFIIFYEESR